MIKFLAYLLRFCGEYLGFLTLYKSDKFKVQVYRDLRHLPKIYSYVQTSAEQAKTLRLHRDTEGWVTYSSIKKHLSIFSRAFLILFRLTVVARNLLTCSKYLIAGIIFNTVERLYIRKNQDLIEALKAESDRRMKLR